MSDCHSPQRSDEEAAIEREIREGRKFTMEEAIARLAGPGMLKGESPVARIEQARSEIGTWLRTHLSDAGGALEVVLHRRVSECELLLTDFDEPLAVLASYCQHLLESDYQLSEFVRECDVEWGRMMGERPHFEIAGRSSHADDPYTLASVRSVLSQLLQQLNTTGDA
jgi:hypothetical protein